MNVGSHVTPRDAPADVSLRGLPRSRRRGVLGYFPAQVTLLHPVVRLLLTLFVLTCTCFLYI